MAVQPTIKVENLPLKQQINGIKLTKRGYLSNKKVEVQAAKH
jgi:hypothetical protein